MADHKFNVLFLCTHNSARSVMAEALLNVLGRERFQAFSAGSMPSGRVNPFAVEKAKAIGFDTSAVRSKSWDEFAAPGAPHMDIIVTVCDDAAGEVCPVWPGQPMTAHWGMRDPAAVEGPDQAIRNAFLDTFITMKRRIELMLALPIASLDKMALQREIKDIGTQ